MTRTMNSSFASLLLTPEGRQVVVRGGPVGDGRDVGEAGRMGHLAGEGGSMKIKLKIKNWK